MRKLISAISSALLAGCQNNSVMPSVSHVDLQRFMGDWYVIANIPTYPEKGAHNAVESYRLTSDGSIATTFSFNAKGFSGERKTFTSTAYVINTNSNAEWGMQFVWPFKAEYLIVYLDDDYQYTIIGRTKRDYLWIMARTPDIPAAEFERILARTRELGYDVGKIEKVPQHWPGTTPE